MGSKERKVERSPGEKVREERRPLDIPPSWSLSSRA